MEFAATWEKSRVEQNQGSYHLLKCSQILPKASSIAKKIGICLENPDNLTLAGRFQHVGLRSLWPRENSGDSIKPEIFLCMEKMTATN
jgi:hypothetical protein